MVNPKLDLLQDYPFARLAKLIADLTPPADKKPIIMSIGEPQLNPPAFVPEILQREALGWGRYPAPSGTPELRQAIADWLTRRYALPAGTVSADRHVFPVAGSREALFHTALAVVPEQKGGGRPVVLAPNPFYQVYIGAGAMAGAETKLLECTRQSAFLPDLDAVDEATWQRTALVYICTPANPQGAVASLDYLIHALDLCRKHDAVLAVDECYAEIYRDQKPAGGMEAAKALKAPGEIFANLLVFHSLSKRSSAPGLRSGFVAGDARLIELLNRLRSYGGASVPAPIMAASTALWRDEKHVEDVRAHYNECFDIAAQFLHNRFAFYKPAGGFFLWLDVGDSEAAARKLWGEAAVKVVPGLYLAKGEGENNPGRRYIRVALVHDIETTREAMRRMADVL
ncbi:MAG: aspartate aminotransferase [Alphaproteobacteria bacterium]|jgi:succinyldiaminopimelate transaminase|nr:aspartate aminotransferase [Alphaproteobacteria bacterium]